MVRAKFKVDSITRKEFPGMVQNEIAMTPVYSGDEDSENAKFWNATPSGKIEFTCVNEDAVKQFEVGKEYYVDFTKAE